jgi:hypothetical protein
MKGLDFWRDSSSRLPLVLGTVLLTVLLIVVIFGVFQLL